MNVLNYAPWLSVRASDSDLEADEILIYDQIGKDWLEKSGVNTRDFDTALKDIPDHKPLNVRINSPGGNVWDGLAIYNMLERRRATAHVRTIVDGMAASIASVIAMVGSEIRMAEDSMLMIHDCAGVVLGDADEMRRMADVLDKHNGVIAAIYARRTGKPASHYRELMAVETWFNGIEARGEGLADVVTSARNVKACFDLSKFKFKNTPVALLNGTAPDRLSMIRSEMEAAEGDSQRIIELSNELLALTKTQDAEPIDEPNWEDTADVWQWLYRRGLA